MIIDESQFMPQHSNQNFYDIAQHMLLEVEVMDFRNSSKAYVVETSFSVRNKKWNKKKSKKNGFNKGEGSSMKFNKN